MSDILFFSVTSPADWQLLDQRKTFMTDVTHTVPVRVKELRNGVNNTYRSQEGNIILLGTALLVGHDDDEARLAAKSYGIT